MTLHRSVIFLFIVGDIRRGGHRPPAYTLPRGEGGFFEPTKEDRKRRVRNGEMSDAG